jgi:uncharacterized membrane protein YdbT with pleckstrin-like domain
VATDSDRVIYSGHPSWRSVLDFYIKGLGLVVLAGAATAGVTTIANGSVDALATALIAVAALALVLLIGLLKRLATTYEITDQHLRIRRGVLSRDFQECRLARVQNVSTRQKALERVLGVGTVDFDTAGTAGADFAFVGVADPEAVMREVDAAQRSAEAAAAQPEQPV